MSAAILAGHATRSQRLHVFGKHLFSVNFQILLWLISYLNTLMGGILGLNCSPTPGGNQTVLA